MNRRMNRLYVGLFRSFPLMGFFWAFFFPYLGHIEDTKSVEFASVAICPTFFHKMTGLYIQIKKISGKVVTRLIFVTHKLE